MADRSASDRTGRRVVLSMFVSLDGYINGVGSEFVGPRWSEDLDRWTADMAERFDTLLYGRRAWEAMAAFWPAAETDANAPSAQRTLGRFMNGARKIVFTRSMSDATAWQNSVIATAGVVETIAREKAHHGKDMVIFAGASFAQTALRARVVDEISLLTIPVLFGGGTRLFENHCHRVELRLLEARPMDTGALLSRYETIPTDRR